ncbi:MAG TPA: DedA family protein [Planctomycetota bacterium]|nr:DedA family protein [Planctomycetota bacterium]
MDFDALVQWITNYPYIGVALVFVLCGLGLPLPEELVLIAGGYVCAKVPDKAQLWVMMCWCAGGILTGDLIPYTLGRVFGVRLLRLRPLRLVVTKQRLAKFDRWFRRRGDMVIIVARFVPGIRVVAFFTAGAMKLSWLRFLLLDGAGIVVIVPLLTLLGRHSAGVIDDLIDKMQRLERGILWSAVGATLLLLAWFWMARRQRRRRRALAVPGETFIEPRVQPKSEVAEPLVGPEPPITGALPPPDTPAS